MQPTRPPRSSACLDIMVWLRETATMGRLKTFVIVSLAAGGPALAAMAQDDIRNVGPGRLTLELRPRWNRIDESDKPLRAEGYTLRALLGWRSQPWHDLRLTVEG